MDRNRAPSPGLLCNEDVALLQERAAKRKPIVADPHHQQKNDKERCVQVPTTWSCPCDPSARFCVVTPGGCSLEDRLAKRYQSRGAKYAMDMVHKQLQAEMRHKQQQEAAEKLPLIPRNKRGTNTETEEWLAQIVEKEKRLVSMRLSVTAMALGHGSHREYRPSSHK